MVIPPSSPKPFMVPVSLLILDLLGLAIVGFGVAEQIGRVNFIPESLRFNGAGLVIMLLGVACMLPLVFKLLKISKLAKQQEGEWLKGLPETLQQKISENIKHESRK